jgi:hypothetical protein
MTAASLDPSDDDAIDSQFARGAFASVHDAPESELLQMRAPSMTAASLDPSEDDAIEDHSARGADASHRVHVTPRVTLLQMAPRSPDMTAASLQVATVVTADAALHALLAIA